MKKYIILIVTLLALFLNLSLVNWNYDRSNNWYKAVTPVNYLNLKVYEEWNHLKATWNKYTWENFKWYKLVRSETNSNPAYPDDWYISYFEDENILEENIENKKWGYYRVCVITYNNDRYCSNVVKIASNLETKNVERKTETKKTTSRVSSTSSLDKKIDTIVLKFLTKMENKYKDVDLRIKKLEYTVKALNSLAAKNSKYKIVVEKVNLRINKYISELANWLNEVEKIFNNL